MKNQDINKPELAKKLRALRIEKGMRTADVAKICNCSRQEILAYERGIRVPRDSVKVVLANCYEKTVQELFFCADKEMKENENDEKDDGRCIGSTVHDDHRL